MGIRVGYGGIIHVYHITLALAMGADFIMLGRYFAHFDESPTEEVNVNGNYIKEYWGEGSACARNLQCYDMGGAKKMNRRKNMDWKYEDGRIYSTNEKGELMCETTFIRKENGEMDIDHTYVNPVLRGQGVAAKMMAVVAEYFRKEGLKTTATCSYANIWLTRHEGLYPDILSEDLVDQAMACKIDGKH